MTSGSGQKNAVLRIVPPIAGSQASPHAVGCGVIRPSAAHDGAMIIARALLEMVERDED